MARPIRVEFEDAVYHVTARGAQRRATFRDDADRARFLQTLEETCQRFGLVVHASCLMSNHGREGPHGQHPPSPTGRLPTEVVKCQELTPALAKSYNSSV